MPLGHDDIQYKVFGNEGTVYPGHPVSIAYLILLTFPSWEAATAREDHSGRSSYPAALTHGGIPGAGGNVWAALDLLKHCFSAGLEEGLKLGDDWWARSVSGANYGDRQAPGQAQAEGIKDAFRAAFAAWLDARHNATA